MAPEPGVGVAAAVGVAVGPAVGVALVPEFCAPQATATASTMWRGVRKSSWIDGRIRFADCARKAKKRDHDRRDDS